MSDLAAKRDHHAAVACELLLAGHVEEARRHARERRRVADLIAAEVPPQVTSATESDANDFLVHGHYGLYSTSARHLVPGLIA